MTYAYATEWMDKEEREQFDAELEMEPGKLVKPKSHGTGDLMRAMGMPGAGQ